jgi:hypothetical protein
MKKHAFSIAFAIGALAAVWVAAAVASSHVLVLVMTAVIAGVYGFGALELRQYRANTTALNQAMAEVPAQMAQLDDWLARVPAHLQNAVRQRVEGERSALPGPALTPYLVGLLVMLGMLGTFLGMVVTLNGAVFALEGASSVQGMRAAFSEPVKGLGLAFGTSVAGVATSAMLGLMSSLARRERALAAQTLDGLIGTGLRTFSLAHQRKETFVALQQQTQLLPQVVQQLHGLMAQMERHSQQLGERLLANQDSFHREVKTVYTDLAQSVDQTLRGSLSQSVQVVSDSIRPVVQSTMTEMAQQAQTLHERAVQNSHEHLETLNQKFSQQAQTVAQNWSAALNRHDQASNELLGATQKTLQDFGQTFERQAQDLLASVRSAQLEQQTSQASADQARLQAWATSLQEMATTLQSGWQDNGRQTLAQQQQICDTLTHTAQAISTQVQTQASQTLADIERMRQGLASTDAQRLAAWQEGLQALSASLQAQWQTAGEKNLAQQQQVCDSLGQTAAQIRSDAQAHASQTLGEVARLMASNEALVQTRLAAEAESATQHQRRAEELASLLRTELAALREQEALRADAAVARLAELQTAVTQHLSTLGTALEAPITRLIETASEAPKAAAEVIGQLRQEISVSVARDNALLEERTRILSTLSTLLDAINHASTEQRSVIDALVTSSKASLQEASDGFAAHVSTESAKLGDLAAQVTASAVDVASLGETFAFAVRSFNETNDKLMASLHSIESALAQSMTRSDEQLAYYVAQAREIIDLSIGSQKDVLEALQQHQAQHTREAA